jgi:hypothetical protein
MAERTDDGFGHHDPGFCWRYLGHHDPRVDGVGEPMLCGVPLRHVIRVLPRDGSGAAADPVAAPG